MFADPPANDHHFNSPRDIFENIRFTFGNGQKSLSLAFNKQKSRKQPDACKCIPKEFNYFAFVCKQEILVPFGLNSFLNQKHKSNAKKKKQTKHKQTCNNNCTLILLTKNVFHAAFVIKKVHKKIQSV